MTMNLSAGDIGYVKWNFGRYEQHPSTAALSTLRGLRGRHRQSDWITHTPPEMAQTLNLSTEPIAKFPRGKPEIAPT
jgi:hypothetical protein